MNAAIFMLSIVGRAVQMPLARALSSSWAGRTAFKFTQLGAMQPGKLLCVSKTAQERLGNSGGACGGALQASGGGVGLGAQASAEV